MAVLRSAAKKFDMTLTGISTEMVAERDSSSVNELAGGEGAGTGTGREYTMDLEGSLTVVKVGIGGG